MPEKLKNVACSLLGRAGFHQSYVAPPIDLRGLLDNPAEAIGRSAGNPVLVNLPLASCRSMLAVAFACTNTSGQPFIDTARGILNGSVTGYIGSPLQRYYESFQPSNLAELLGIEPTDKGPASRLPPYAFVFPWHGTPTVQQCRIKSQKIRKENMFHGSKLSGSNGWHLIGPISPEKGILEFERLSKTLCSIQKNGYKRNNGPDGDMVGVILVRDDTCVAVIAPGQHRISALVALGYDKAPVRISCTFVPIVYRETATSWPAVKNGFMTVEQALSVFDRVFEGQQPPGFSKT